MPNVHAIDKVCVSTWVPRTLHRQLVKLAAERKMKLSELIEHIYTQETKDVELTAKDYRAIAEAIEAAEQGRDMRVGKKRSRGEDEEKVSG